MNLILVSCLILAWAGFHKKSDVILLGLNVFQLAESTPLSRRPEKLNDFISQVRINLADGMDDRMAIGSVKVSMILSLADMDLRSMFPKTKTLTEEERVEASADVRERVGPFEVGGGVELSTVHESRVLYSPEAQRFSRYISEVDRLFANSDATEKSSMKDLHEKVVPKIEVPFLKQKVPLELATILMSIGLITVYLYLVSTCQALKEECRVLKQRTGQDWIFLHPGSLGFCLGSVWLAGPSIIVFSGWVFVGFPKSLSPILGLLLSGAAVWSILTAISVRRSFLRRIQEICES